MSATDVQPTRSAGRSRLLILVVSTLVLLAATAVYFRVGWWRMESACSIEVAQGSIYNSVSYGWSWQPLGFQCTYDNGESENSLWF